MTDYELEYQRNESACGEPFPQFVKFFDSLEKVPSTVLDLGCGQGRDALMIATRGHIVCGVDISSTGISQMKERASAFGFSIEGIVADICSYEPANLYDVVLLDRVIHMLRDDNEKGRLLAKAAKATHDGGFVLVADTPGNIPMIERFFGSSGEWSCIFGRKGFQFYQRTDDTAEN